MREQSLEEEIEKLNSVVDAFAEEMKAKFKLKAEQGYRGWDEVAGYTSGALLFKLKEQVARERQGNPQEVDIANFACLIWYRRKFQEEG